MLFACALACGDDDPRGPDSPASPGHPSARASAGASGRGSGEGGGDAQSVQSVQSVQPVELVELRLRADAVHLGDAVRAHLVVEIDPDADPHALAIPLAATTGDAQVELVGLERDRDDPARVRFDYRVEPQATGEVVLTAGDPDDGGSTLTAALAVEAPFTAEEAAAVLAKPSTRLERGRSLARQGDYRQAIAVYQLALEHAPEDPTLLSELGWAAFLAGRHNLARRATRAGLRHATDAERRGALLYNLGRIAEAQGETGDAIGSYRRSLAARPGNATVAERLASLGADPWPPRCTDGLCVIADQVDRRRACEIIEEESCPLLTGGVTPGCSCNLDDAEALDRFRLVPVGSGDAGQVYWLLVESLDAAERYDLLAPLLVAPAYDREAEVAMGGLRDASTLTVRGRAEPVLRVRMGRSIQRGSATVEVEWERLCVPSEVAGLARCTPALLTAYRADGTSRYSRSLEVDADGRINPTNPANPAGPGRPGRAKAPDAEALAAVLPGVGFHVVREPTSLDALLGGADSPDR